MKIKELVRRYILFIIGLFVNSLGICCIIKANLGSSPISSLPYTISLNCPISLGTLTFILNLFLIAGQMLILKKDFKQREWLQLPISVLFGVFIDFSMILLSWVNPDSYALQLVVLVVGCAILGLGVSMEVIANVVMLSGEAFVQAISLKKKKEFGMVKIFFDSSLMVAAVIVSLLLYGEVMGVREGTIVAAIIVGMFARYFNRRLAFVNRYLTTDTPAGSETEAVPTDNGHFVITIAREYGSGGREIGKQLAQHFGIPFYDRELIDMAAKSEGRTDALKSCTYTGIAYLITVILLILPYILFESSMYIPALVMMLLTVILIIAGFTYYISVAQDMPFRSRFVEMAGISISVAVISFVVGIAAKRILGVDI